MTVPGFRDYISRRRPTDGTTQMTDSPLDRPLRVTFFRNRYAGTKTEESCSLRDLMPLLQDTEAASKEALPWIKLARFGGLRTAKNSLRHDGNVLSIDGIEADYDGGKITLERARSILRVNNVAAVLYASPSHTAAMPRWRALCPTSAPLPPEARANLVARLNGIFVGALAGESFTLSQAYYYGRVEGHDDHSVVAVEGAAIDLLPGLDAGAVHRASPPDQPPPPPRNPASVPPRSDGGTPYGLGALASACQAIRGAPDGVKHATINREAYSIGGLVPDEVDEGVAWADLQSAVRDLHPACKSPRDADRTAARAFAEGMARTRTVSERPAEPPLHPAAIAIIAKAQRQMAARQSKPLPVAPELMDVPGALGMFVDHCERTAISPQPFLALAAGICLVGALAGRRYRTATDLRTNIYAVGVADSGAGKDHARKVIKAVLAQAGLTKYLGGERIASGQAMLTALLRHPAQLFQIDEFGDFLADVLSPKASAHRRDIASALKTLYSSASTFMAGTEYANAKDRPREDIQQPHACLYATTTPGQLWTAIAGRSLHDGLMARVLVCVSPCSYPDEAPGTHEPVPAALIGALQAIAAGAEPTEEGNLAMLRLNPALVPNSAQAEAAYHALRSEQLDRQRQHEGTYVTAIVGRLAENAMKLALVRAVSRDPAGPRIEAEDVAWGRALALHCIETLLREAEQNVAESEFERRMNHALNIIRKFGPISEGDMVNRRKWRISPRERKEVLDTIVSSGLVTTLPGKAGGRPTVRFVIAATGAESPDTVQEGVESGGANP